MKIIYKSYMARPLKPFGEWDWEVREAVKTAPVSYTHLTLPTSDLV